MSEIVLIDTSIYLNVLDVPGWNQDRADVLAEFKERIERSDSFLLPMASIWETGNHIADLPDGARRREYAIKLVDQVTLALNGGAPYIPTHFPDKSEILLWISDFPEYAMRNKSVEKPNEGVSLADMSIIKEWERVCRQNSLRAVLIWSLDSDLSGYQQASRMPARRR